MLYIQNSRHMQHSITQITACGSTKCIHCISPSSQQTLRPQTAQGYILKWLQNLILWDKDFHLSVVCLQASSFHCNFTTLNYFFHRHWRLRQYLPYTCSCNWYMNGKFFTSTTEWKQKVKFSFQKRSKLNFDLYFDMCRSVEFILVSSISVLQ